MGRWGECRGSQVNKLGPERGNHLLLIKLFGPFFSGPQGVYWTFFERRLSPAKGPRSAVYSPFATLWGSISMRIKKQILFFALDAAR